MSRWNLWHVSVLLWEILAIPAGAQTIQADSTFGALNPEKILRDSLRVGETIETWKWNSAKWEWENTIITVPDTGNIALYQDATSPLALIRGYSLFIDDSTFVLLQRLNKSKFGWVTDSITWVPIDTTFVGESNCQHAWVYGEPDIAGDGFVTHSCLVYHPPGQHCDFNNDVREKICRRCLRSVIESEQWFQHFVAPHKTEFEILKERQRSKQ